MNTKLTLTLEKDVIEKAKKYAARQGQSLSSLVEAYFSQLTQNRVEEQKDEALKPLPESLLKLRGSLKSNNYEPFDYKEELTKALREKHGL